MSRALSAFQLSGAPPQSSFLLIQGADPFALRLIDQWVAPWQAQAQCLRFALSDPASWSPELSGQNTLDLFQPAKVITLYASKEPAKKMQQQLLEACQHVKGPIKLILQFDKLAASAKQQAWYQHCLQHGPLVFASALKANEMPRWLAAEAKKLDLTLDQEALHWLTHAFEGNPQQAQQVLSQAQHLAQQQPLTAEQLQRYFQGNPQLQLFELSNALLRLDGPRALHLLHCLQQQQEPINRVLWLLQKELKILALCRSQPMAQVFQSQRIWQSQQSLYRQAHHNLSATQLRQLFQRTAQLEVVIKVQHQQPWHDLQALVQYWVSPLACNLIDNR